METDNGFDTYLKDDTSDSCHVFEDFGFETKCQGGSNEKIATNVGSLEGCKNLCKFLSFECKGIEYKSNCNDHTQDTCKIFAGGEITGSTGSSPTKANFVNIETDHCLKFNGTVANATGSLMMFMHVGLNGVDPAIVTSANAREPIAAQVKEALANHTPQSIVADHIEVQVSQSGAENVAFDIEIKLEAPGEFIDVRQALKDNEANIASTFTTLIGQINNTIALGSGPFAFTAFSFNLNNTVFVTSTTTETTTPCTVNCTTVVTTTSALVVSGALRLPPFVSQFIWCAAFFFFSMHK
jgi:hypothetical protein